MTFKIAVSKELAPYFPDFPVFDLDSNDSFGMTLILVSEDGVWVDRVRARARPFMVVSAKDAYITLTKLQKAGAIGKFTYIDPSTPS